MVKGLEGGNKPEASVALLFTLKSTAREKVAKKEGDLLSLFPPQPNTHRLLMITNETVLKIFSSECLQRFNWILGPDINYIIKMNTRNKKLLNEVSISCWKITAIMSSRYRLHWSQSDSYPHIRLFPLTNINSFVFSFNYVCKISLGRGV